jgi:hypothetical protein
MYIFWAEKTFKYTASYPSKPLEYDAGVAEVPPLLVKCATVFSLVVLEMIPSNYRNQIAA